MKSSVDQFDKEHMMCLEKVQMLDWKLKLANLRQLTLYQELLLLKEVDKSERILQDKLDKRLREQNELLVRNQLSFESSGPCLDCEMYSSDFKGSARFGELDTK